MVITIQARTEDEIQAAFFKAWWPIEPADVQTYHAANGGSRNLLEAVKFKRMGVKPGVPDVPVVLPDGRAGFIEFKRPGKKIKPGSDQDKFRIWCEARGVPWAVCTHEADAVEILLMWIKQARRNAA